MCCVCVFKHAAEVWVAACKNICESENIISLCHFITREHLSAHASKDTENMIDKNILTNAVMKQK